MAREEDTPSPNPRARATILLVDDEDVVLRVTAAVLRRLGYDVLEAASGQEGSRLASERAGRIDLLLTDLSMGETSGIEVAAVFREHNPGRPVVYTSGYTDDELLGRMTREGGRFLPKPYDMRDLERTLAQVLAHPPREAGEAR